MRSRTVGTGALGHRAHLRKKKQAATPQTRREGAHARTRPPYKVVQPRSRPRPSPDETRPMSAPPQPGETPPRYRPRPR